jgi:hypothetical protein
MAEKFQKFTTEKGVAVWPHLNRPDTKFAEGGAGTFHTKVRVPLTAKTQEIIDAIDAAIEAERVTIQKAKGPKVKLKMANPPYSIGEGDEEGTVTFTVKRNVTKRDGTPLTPHRLFDAKGKPMRLDSVVIGGGSTIKVNFSIMPFPNYSATIGVGVKLGLEGVMLVELQSFGGPSADRFGFDAEEDGYSAEESAPARASTVDDENDAGGADDESEDF